MKRIFLIFCINLFALNFFTPRQTVASDAPTAKPETVRLSLETDPEGASCRCESEKAGNPPKGALYVVDKTPGSIEVPKGVYPNIYCDCLLQNQNNCQRLTIIFSANKGEIDRSHFKSHLINSDMIEKASFSYFSRLPNYAGDCRVIDQKRCSADRDCVPYKDFSCCAGVHTGGQICVRKDADFAGIDRMREEACSGGNLACEPVMMLNGPLDCVCVKGGCEIKGSVSAE